MKLGKFIIPMVALSAMLATSAAFAVNHEVMIKGMKFSPAVIDVAVGDTVTFTNMDGAPHTATAKNGAFDTGRLNKGEKATVEIATAGAVDYFCGVHPSMTGTVSAK